MHRLDEAKYLSWVQHVFDHPVMNPAWYWDLNAESSEPAPPECVANLTQLFAEPEILATYSDAQVNQGFWYLVSNTGSNYMFSLIEPGVDWPERQTAIRSIAILFARLFARRCSNHLSHFDEPGACALNSVCYMWWELFPAAGRPGNPEFQALDAELLAVMKQVLTLDSIACQESALHGLGHWHFYYPVIVEKTIDEFLTRVGNIREELRDYARCARQGCVQ
ncbi:MAG: hypothetical protein K8R36_11150 [Planctomycetales bacterium]|nr:hypothetical protein [Planctomycetales bacterium]